MPACSYPGCPNRSESAPSHRPTPKLMPAKNKMVQEAWYDFLVTVMHPMRIRNNIVLCEAHFEEDQKEWKENKERWMMKKKAVPTIHTHHIMPATIEEEKPTQDDSASAECGDTGIKLAIGTGETNIHLLEVPPSNTEHDDALNGEEQHPSHILSANPSEATGTLVIGTEEVTSGRALDQGVSNTNSKVDFESGSCAWDEEAEITYPFKTTNDPLWCCIDYEAESSQKIVNDNMVDEGTDDTNEDQSMVDLLKNNCRQDELDDYDEQQLNQIAENDLNVREYIRGILLKMHQTQTNLADKRALSEGASAYQPDPESTNWKRRLKRSSSSNREIPVSFDSTPEKHAKTMCYASAFDSYPADSSPTLMAVDEDLSTSVDSNQYCTYSAPAIKLVKMSIWNPPIQN